jgi:AcrR family transcriptional regulator
MSGPERKAQIIDVVLRLVHEHGVEGTTTARIARAAGVTEPTLYQYFGSRRDMLLAALDLVFDRATEAVECSQDGDAVECLRKIGEYHTRETKAKALRFVDPMFEFVVAPAEEGLRDRVRAGNLEIHARLAGIIEKGKAQGRMRPEVDAKRIAWRIMGFYWFEDVSTLMDLGEVVSEGVSQDTFNAILADTMVPSSGC